jgi:hypothetical protein
VLPDGATREYVCTGYVRVSEPIDVTWTGIDDDSMIQNAVTSLDEEILKIRNETAKRIDEIEQRRSQFLALVHQV